MKALKNLLLMTIFGFTNSTLAIGPAASVTAKSNAAVLAQLRSTKKFKSFGGGSDGGSCGVYLSESRFTLKDFERAGKRGYDRFTPGDKIHLGPVATSLGFERLDGKFGTVDFRQLSVYKTALHRLEAWKADSPELAIKLLSALRSVEFVGFKDFLKLEVSGQQVAYGCDETNDSPAIVYISLMAKALISVPVWNSFSQDSQIGAIYKESLRLMQAEYQTDLFSGEGMTDRSEKALSELVATLVFETPRPGAQTLNQILLQNGFPVNSEAMQIQKLVERMNQFCQKALTVISTPCHATGDLEVDAINLNHVMTDGLKIVGQNGNRKKYGFLFAEEVTEIYQSMLAFRLQLIIEKPETKIAIKRLNEVTNSLQTCTATSQGETCSFVGESAISRLSEAIYKSSQSSISFLSLSERQAVERIAAKLKTYAR